MVQIKTARELSLMKDACRISAQALRAAGEAIRPGVSTLEIDTIVRHYIEKQGATPSFLGYGGFPASACISVNNVVIHGIPDKYTVLREGDIVSVDTGAYYNMRELSRQPSATALAISAARFRGMSKLAVTRWYEITSATA